MPQLREYLLSVLDAYIEPGRVVAFLSEFAFAVGIVRPAGSKQMNVSERRRDRHIFFGRERLFRFQRRKERVAFRSV